MDATGYPAVGGMPPEGEYYSAQGPYKERFHATRDRYAHATQTQDEYRKELDACLAKERVLQEEVNLLIDVLGVTLADSPTVRDYMSMTPPPPPPRQLPHGTPRHRETVQKPKVEEKETLPHPPPQSQSQVQRPRSPMYDKMPVDS